MSDVPETATGGLSATSVSPSPPISRPPPKLQGKVKVILVMLIFVLTVPTLTTLVECVSLAIMADRAYNGVHHLLDVKDIFTGLKGHLTTTLLDAHNLHRAQDDLNVAHEELQQVSVMLSQDVIVGAMGSVFPRQIVSVGALTKIGIDATEMGSELVSAALKLSSSLSGSVLTDTKQPLITPSMLALVRPTLAYMLPRLSDIQTQSASLSLDALPFISMQQREQLKQGLQLLPLVRDNLVQAYDLMDAIGWILGVGQPRTLLVQTMDRAELRPTGGFTGQFAELHINGGRVETPQLQDIGPREEGNPEAASNGQLAPAPYNWWPIGNWGLRDSNLSVDFPTSARLAMDRYQFEFKTRVDGVILFSPFLIQDILRVIGPIYVPKYNETVTAQNLEALLHYYQLDHPGIRKEELVEGVSDESQARKLFTKKLSQLLVEKLRHVPPDEVLAIVSAMLHSLQTKNLQVYVSNPTIEGLLAKYNATGQLDRSLTHDGLYVVQANISASKASQYVQTIMHDTVTLDGLGGATHVLQLRLVYNQIGPVYGLDTYHDYVRVYVPPTSQWRWGDGFEQTERPLCGGPYRACLRYDIYGNGDLLCPAGLFDSGYRTDTLGDRYARGPHPLNMVGAPTNMVSDEQGRAMFGGWIVVPKNCTATATLSWYVPPMGNAPYSLLVQRQSSTFPELDLAIVPTARSCNVLKTGGVHFDGIMSTVDLSFSLHTIAHGVFACMPQPPL